MLVAPPLDRGGTFPPGGVAFRMSIAELPIFPGPDSRFPIELSNFRASRTGWFSPGQYAKRERPRVLAGSIVGDGVPYSASAFYGLEWKGEAGGNANGCKIRLDRRHDEFYCTNSTARWNRVGAVIRVPRGSRSRDPLPMIAMKIAWDGHLIANETTGAGDLPPAAVRVLWPNWRGGR